MPTFWNHTDPAWYELPHYSLILPVPDSEDTYEQLVTRQIGERRFLNLCIPYLLYDLALGDEIEVLGAQTEFASGSGFRVVRSSGRFVFRVMFSDLHKDKAKAAVKDIKQAGGLVERWNARFYSIDAENEALASVISGYLGEGEERGLWEYETGRLS